MLYDIQLFFQTFWQPLLIITTAAVGYCSILKWYGKMSLAQTIALFLTGIIVITCIFLPFNWSISNAGQAQELNIFFFKVNIEGNNFIQGLKNTLGDGKVVSGSGVENTVTFFLAFLEEFAKLVLLIFLVKKILKWPIVLLGILLLGKIVYEYYSMAGIPLSQTILIAIGGLIMIGTLTLSLSFSTQLESVSDYIFSIALVAAGFAFAENIKYMMDLFHQGQTDSMIRDNAILRSIFGYLSHIFFSMICVLIYARGRFAFLRAIDTIGSVSPLQKTLGWKNYTTLMTWIGFVGGVSVATLLHGYYNTMIATGDVGIPSTILIVGFLFLELFVLHNLRNTTRYGLFEEAMT
ncbi:MAG: PrsW family glutamic-type intramembrane protease [Candidatus Gracilibacteria bacterium]